MDTLRDSFGGMDDALAAEDEIGEDRLPPEIGTDERRMQVRAYNFWAGMLDNRNYPDIADLDPAHSRDFAPNAVLLDFSDSSEDPAIAYLGEKLAVECDTSADEIGRLSEVPGRSLLSRITDHYMQILANQAPIGFEAEFVNQRGATILYRGILLPFSSDDHTIDFIFGVINWKEMADAQKADELLLEIGQQLDRPDDRGVRRASGQPMPDWADGPGSLGALIGESALPRPSFGLDPDAPADHHGSDGPGRNDAPALDPDTMSLADWLASARDLAQAACSAEDRTRKALYDAVSRAYDFSRAARESADEYRTLVEEAGLTMQDRAPMTPIVKLVFGSDYDKTRLTEYAAALTHAHRLDLARGALGEFLRRTQGGLKGVVQAERRLRRQEGDPPQGDMPSLPRPALARKLRAVEARPLDEVEAEGEEFALVMIRRTGTGEVMMLGEVHGDRALLEKAARTLLG